MEVRLNNTVRQELFTMPQNNTQLVVTLPEKDVIPLFDRALTSVREELRTNSYILEALRVLPVGGYRSAIGSFWNAVIDDLRNKVIWRSLKLFNKAVNVGREIKAYEDFIQFVNDDQLLDGAYKIGVITFEASRVLGHAKETRHFFSGHPKSSEPSIIKVLAMMDDCIKYVLNSPYPAKIIYIDDYMKVLDSADFDRNQFSIEIAMTELPENYKNELVNRLFSAYCHQASSSTIRSNIEFVIPILWPVLPRDIQLQVVRRVDQEVAKGNAVETEQAFKFVSLVKAQVFLTPTARRYKIQPLVQRLIASQDKWKEENEATRELRPFASIIPAELMYDYVRGLTHTYVGYTGSSFSFSRTNFYADEAAIYIPTMFELFDDRAAESFVRALKESVTLKERISNTAKLARLRTLAGIVLGKVSAAFIERAALEALADPLREEEAMKIIYKKG